MKQSQEEIFIVSAQITKNASNKKLVTLFHNKQKI